MTKAIYTFFFSVVLFFSAGITLAAQDGAISGLVKDRISGEPLVGAVVVHTVTGERALTDFDGRFSFKGLEPGKHSFRISYISYEEKLLEKVEVTQDNNESLNINLTKALRKVTRKTAPLFKPELPLLS